MTRGQFTCLFWHLNSTHLLKQVNVLLCHPQKLKSGKSKKSVTCSCALCKEYRMLAYQKYINKINSNLLRSALLSNFHWSPGNFCDGGKYTVSLACYLPKILKTLRNQFGMWVFENKFALLAKLLLHSLDSQVIFSSPSTQMFQTPTVVLIHC